MDLGIIRPINIDVEMQASYLDYAMSVIVARALPDVRDGLKPVHRRILYAMHDLGLDPDKPYKKSARIVGEVLGKYHPHGDVAVYEAMVRMAQDFSLRYPLVDGQGNFGSVDGDNAAAMRYTEARLAPIAVEMLTDIEKDTVEWTDNFDGTLDEPSVLPAALPNLVVNGASGIAVGMSTNIPPHNLGEVCDALCYLIDNYRRAEEVPVEELMQFIPGPDFPTGGLIYRYQHENGTDGEEQVDVIARAYASGKGRIVVQAKAHIEEMSRSRSRIVVSELPYQTNKSNLMERIAELVRDGRLEGITDLRDESDRTGMRICIETTRTVEPRDVLRELYKLTPLQSTFSISLLALVEGQPLLLSLKRLLLHFLEHRQEVIRRRSEFDLKKAKQRAHILEGLLRALDVLDQVIALIRGSRTSDTAKQGLMKEFEFTELQAQAILDMQLRRLAALERRKLQDEYKEVLARIKDLEELLASPKKVLALIRKDLVQLKATYGDPRRTQIADRVKGALTTIDVLPDQEVWVTLNADGVLMRRPKDSFDTAWRKKLAADAGAALTGTNTRNDLYLFSAKGQAVRLGVHQVPEGNGAHFADLSGLTRRDRIVAILALPKPQADGPTEGLLVLGTAQGKVKRVNLSDLAEQVHANPQVINLDSNDELAWMDRSAGGGEVLLMTAQGQAIRFVEDDVRAMGLPAGGIGGIRLKVRDRVVGGLVVPAGTRPDSFIATVTDKGWGKRTLLSEFPAQGRNGQGVVAAKVSSRSGRVAGVALMVSDEALVCSLGAAGSHILAGGELPAVGRAALGKTLFALPPGQQVTNVAAIPGLAPAPPPAPPTSRAAAPKTGGTKTTRSNVAKVAGAAVAVKAAKAAAGATASPSAGRSKAAGSDKAPKSPRSAARWNAPSATEPEAPPAKAATAAKASRPTRAASRKAATTMAEPPKAPTTASSRGRGVKTTPAAAPQSEPEVAPPRRARASTAAKTASAAPTSAPSGARSKTGASNGATADAKLAGSHTKTTQTTAPKGEAQGKTAKPVTSQKKSAATPAKKLPPSRAPSSKSAPTGAASKSLSKVTATQPTTGLDADQAESSGGRVFNRADLAKLISAPKKTSSVTRPTTGAAAPEAKTPQASNSGKPPSTPKSKKSSTGSTG